MHGRSRPVRGLSEELVNLAQVYSTELARRESERQGQRMEELTGSIQTLTWWIVALTVLIAGATLVGVVLTAWSLLSG